MEELLEAIKELMHDIKEIRKEQKIYHAEMMAVKIENSELKERVEQLENKL